MTLLSAMNDPRAGQADDLLDLFIASCCRQQLAC